MATHRKWQVERYNRSIGRYEFIYRVRGTRNGHFVYERAVEEGWGCVYWERAITITIMINTPCRKRRKVKGACKKNESKTFELFIKIAKEIQTQTL